jgi:hypothetical protein
VVGRESWKRDRVEEVVLAAVQEEVVSESKGKRQDAQRSPRRRMRRRSRRWWGRVVEGRWCLKVSFRVQG